MIIGLYQCPSPAGDMAQAFATLRSAMETAAPLGVDMLVLPEMFLPGYAAMHADISEDWAAIEADLKALCRAHRLALALGLPEVEDGTIYNAAKVFAANGDTLACYRKIQLYGPDERAIYTPGDRYVLFDYMGKRFGLLICYDVEFPEHVRALAGQGAEIILVPTANMMPFANVNQIMVPARAAENAVTIVYANYCGSEGDLNYVGLSGIFGPDGYTLGTKGQGPGLCIATMPSGWSEHGIPLSTQAADYRPVKDDR